MAISARIPYGLDTDKFIPEVFGKNVLMAARNILVVVPAIDHTYEPELQRGDTYYIPRSQLVTATEVTIGTEGVIKDPQTTALTLTIDKYYEAPIVVDYMSRRQSQVDLVSMSEQESAFGIATKIDSTVCDLFATLNSGSAGSTGKGTDGSAVTDDVLIACVEDLDEANAPAEDRVWVFDPSVKADILKIDKFVRADYFAADVIPTGGFRKDVYGAPILITNNLTAKSTGNYGVYMHKKALTIVIQENMTVDRVDQPLKHQLTINTTALWGVGELREDWGLPIMTRLA